VKQETPVSLSLSLARVLRLTARRLAFDCQSLP